MNELEEERKKYLESRKRYKKVSKIVSIVAIITLIAYLCDFPRNNEVTIIAIIVCVVSSIYIGRDHHNDKSDYEEYRKKYREVIVDGVLKEMFTDIETDYSKGIDKGTIRSTNIIHAGIGTSFSSEDYVKGKYKNVVFEVSDVHTSHSDEDGNRIIDFQGQYYIFEFNKEFKGSVRVLYNDEKKIYKKFPDYVELEDEEFNNNFTVLAKDKHLAYYILTPNFVEKIKELAYKFGGVNFLFIDNKVHIAIYNDEDLFEFNVIEKLNLEKESEKVRNNLTDIIKIIDMLDLNDKVFK
ncbi:MAG: DUF3137 domain-containing protein [Bacilli bacterium]|nr:DUF3137 domain-containing protein [Bacilli bacterium]